MKWANNVLAHCSWASVLIFSTFCHAQNDFYNAGQLSIEPGTLVYSEGPMTNDAGGTLSNLGVLELNDQFDNSSGVYTPNTGTLRFVGPGVSAAYLPNNDFVQNFEVYRAGGLVDVSSAFSVSGSVILNDGLVGNAGPVNILPGCAITVGNANSYFQGPVVQHNTGNIFFPVGNGLEYDPMWMNGVVGTGTQIEVRSFEGPSGGTAGTGMYSLNFPYWSATLNSGTLAAISDVQVLDKTVSIYNPRLGQSTTGATGTYNAIGTGTVVPSLAPYVGTYPNTLTAPPDLALGHFITGDCRFVVGAPIPQDVNICQGDTNLVYVNLYDATTFTWQRSTDNVIYFNIAASNNDTLDLQDTLSMDTYFRVVLSGAGCADDTSSSTFIEVIQSLKVRLMAMLEGPYDPFSGQMTTFLNDPGAIPPRTVGLLDSLYLYGGVASSTMYNGYSVPATAVDVVKVELFIDSDLNLQPDLKVAEAPAWVLQDGLLLNFYNGTDDNINICGAAPGLYWVAVKHRNHLPVMTQTEVSLNTTPDPPAIDLRNPGAVHSLFEVKSLPSSPYVGMIAGNVFDDPLFPDVYNLNALDFFYTLFLASLAPDADYWQEDVDFSGFVNSLDYTIVQSNSDQLYFSTVPY